MPSPGGGSRGGGFRGGSGGGGGFRGGSGPSGFRGGNRPGGFYGHHRPHHHHHHHYRPFFFYRRPYYGYAHGGIYHGGLLSALFAPIFTVIILLLVIIAFAGSIVSRHIENSIDNEFAYDEKTLQDYGLKQYAIEFNDSRAYEDNILIIFLVNEERDLYDTIAIVGDNVAKPIYLMFGNEYSEFGSEMHSNIADYYENSLSRNMAGVISGMQNRIVNLNLTSNFITPSSVPSETAPHFTNNTSISISNSSLKPALESFTEATGIPIAVVFDDFEDVYKTDVSKKVPSTFGFGDLITIVVIFAIGGFAIYSIITSVKNYKATKKSDSSTEDDNSPPNIDPEEEKKNNSTHW